MLEELQLLLQELVVGPEKVKRRVDTYADLAQFQHREDLVCLIEVSIIENALQLCRLIRCVSSL